MSDIFKSMLKSELYECLERKGKMLPTINSNIVTKEWLIQVFQNKEYCPNYVDVRLRACPVKPLKKFFIEEIQLILQLNQLYSSLEEKKHEANLEWCVAVLSTLNANHRFFASDYYPSDEERGRGSKVHKESKVSNQEAKFLEGIPIQTFRKSKTIFNNNNKFEKENRFTDDFSNFINDSPEKNEPQNKSGIFQFTPSSQQQQSNEFFQKNLRNSSTKIIPCSQTTGAKIRPLILPQSDQKQQKKQSKNSQEIQYDVSMQTCSNQALTQK